MAPTKPHARELTYDQSAFVAPSLRQRERGTLPILGRGLSDADDGPFYDVEILGGGALVTRTARRYSSTSEVPPSFAEIDVQLGDRDPSQMALLVDLRAIVGRNDPEFEVAVAPFRRQLLASFARSAFLVRTTIGRLQLQRYLAVDGVDAVVFAEMDEAVTWLERSP